MTNDDNDNNDNDDNDDHNDHRDGDNANYRVIDHSTFKKMHFQNKKKRNCGKNITTHTRKSVCKQKSSHQMISAHLLVSNNHKKLT